MRTFIAVSMDEKIQENIRDFQSKMKLETTRFRNDINWVFPDECHSTLAFLGEVPENSLQEICDLVDPIAERTKPFRMKVEGVRAFGRSARVIWAALRDGNEQLELLHRQLVEVLGPAGFYTEKKKFSPHITLARIKDPKAGKYVKDIAVTLGRYPFGAMAVRSIELYKSELTKFGAKYTLLAQFPLGQPEYYR
ncbi:MAG: RNA 2',3'-cyclic phosphodiesterase [Sedimentisphaeraceae bacterium JB056]